MSTHSVMIQKMPANHVDLVGAMREVGGLSFREASELVVYLKSALPCLILAGVDEAKALSAVDQIKRAGGEAIIQASDIKHPMLLCPSVAKIFTFSRIWGVREK